MNASVRWIIRGGIPVGGLLAGLLGAGLGVRGGLLAAAAGLWLAVFWLVCSPLRRQRDFPAEGDRGTAEPLRATALQDAPGGVPGR
jgi:hypothetical protein